MFPNYETRPFAFRYYRHAYYLLGLIILGIVGCQSTTDDPEDLTIASVSVLPNDEPVISLSQEVQLQAVAANSVGTEVASGTVEWATSDPNTLAVTNTGLMTGLNSGTATISATAGGKTGSIDFFVADLTGVWVGGEAPDTVTYTLTQTGTVVEGVFASHLGFPPITDVNTGALTGSLNFGRYFHLLTLTTENNCELEIEGTHQAELDEDGELVLVPSTGSLSSTNCSISGSIDFAMLRRQ